MKAARVFWTVQKKESQIPSLIYFSLSLLDQVAIDGGVYLLPVNNVMYGILYNKTLMEEHGWEVPSNFAELEALCNQIEETGLIPGVLGTELTWATFLMGSCTEETGEAYHAQAAVHLVTRAVQEGHPYDIVLIDWKMPGMDGVEAVRCIRQNCPKDAPLLVLTSYDWTEIEDAARAAGVDTFLAKPFFLTSFRQKVDAVLNRSPEPEPVDMAVLEQTVRTVLEENPT